jgi:hypothetical protein
MAIKFGRSDFSPPMVTKFGRGSLRVYEFLNIIHDSFLSTFFSFGFLVASLQPLCGTWGELK